MTLSRFIPLGALLVVAACAGQYKSILQLDPTPRPPTRPEAVQLIAQEPQRPYTVIAVVSVYSHGWPFEGVPRARLLKEAARLGGEAVLIDNSSMAVIGGDEGRQHQLTGKVIVFNREQRASNTQ
jgi:hypothetical protein